MNAPPASPPPWLHSRAGTIAAVMFMLAIFVALGGRMAWTTSATFDEPGFIVAGYSYQRPSSAEICTTNLRLVPLWLAAPVRLLGPKLPAQLDGAPRLVVSGDLNLGREFLADSRNGGSAILRTCRSANILLGVLLGALLFVWSRRLHGDAGGLLTLGLYCFNPVTIANSAIATTDLGASLLFGLSVVALWRLLHEVTVPNIVGAGVATGALAAAKLSWFLIVPIAAFLLAWRIARRKTTPMLSLRKLVGAGAGVAAIGYVTVWLVYGFRFSPGESLPPETWLGHSSGAPLLYRVVAALRDARALPEAYLFDLQTFLTTGAGRRAFLAGEYSVEGWWYFFPVVWFLKSPLSFLAALLLAAAALIWAKRTQLPTDQPPAPNGLLPLLVLAAAYLSFAMAGRLNIGIRHLLPVYPFLFVFAGGAVRWLGDRRMVRAGALATLLGWSAAEAATVHPDYLAYINVFGGGAQRGYKVLADSSYDWGQDLPAFKTWLNRRASAKSPVYFSYFGNSDLSELKDRVVLLPQYVELRPISYYTLDPGTYVIGSTMLQTLFGPLMGPWRPELENQYQALSQQMQRLDVAVAAKGNAGFDELVAREGLPVWQQRIVLFDYYRFARLCAWLRQREPSGRIARTLLVYELSADDLRAALTGPPAELRENFRIKGSD